MPLIPAEPFRQYSVLAKDPHQEPSFTSAQERARKELAALAAADGFRLIGDLQLQATGYSQIEGLHVVAYSSFARPVPHTGAGRAGPDVLAAVPREGRVRAEVLALRAHRTPLHAMQTVTYYVERALNRRERLAVAIALNVLRAPIRSKSEVAAAHDTLSAIFGEAA